MTEKELLLKVIESLRRYNKLEECWIARPGELTYECRIDNLCPACTLRHYVEKMIGGE